MKIEKIDYSSLNNWAAQYLFESQKQHTFRFDYVPLRLLLHRSREIISLQPNKMYKQVTVRTNFMGASLRTQRYGADIRTKKQYVVRDGQLIVSKIDARNGAFALIPKNLSGAIITANFWAYIVDESKIRPSFLLALMSMRSFLDFAEKSSNGSTGRHYLQEDTFLDFIVPLPTLAEQDSILSQYYQIIDKWETAKRQQALHEKRTWIYVQKKLGIDNPQDEQMKRVQPKVVNFSEMQNWDVNVMNFFQKFNSKMFDTHTLSERINGLLLLQRGQSPRYASPSSARMINQKCVRNGYVDFKYAKEVDYEWSLSVDNNLKTKRGDILICSTGNGTLGRAALIDSNSEGFLFDSHVLLLRLDDSQVSPILFCYLINSPYGQKQMERLKTARTTNQTELGVTNLLKVRFPFPAIKIQNHLAAYIKKNILGKEEECSFSVQLTKAATLLEQLIYD